jgi:cytochrome c oxidase subunit 2
VKYILSGLTRCTQYLSALMGVLFMSGCNLDTRMSTFVTKGPVAETQYDLFMLTVWVTLGIFIVVGGVFVIPGATQ